MTCGGVKVVVVVVVVVVAVERWAQLQGDLRSLQRVMVLTPDESLASSGWKSTVDLVCRNLRTSRRLRGSGRDEVVSWWWWCVVVHE